MEPGLQSGLVWDFRVAYLALAGAAQKDKQLKHDTSPNTTFLMKYPSLISHYTANP